MENVPIDELLNKTGSTYKLVILASLRAIELNEGAHPLVNHAPDAKPVNIAVREILEGKVSYKAKEAK